MDFIPPVYAENKRRNVEMKFNAKTGKNELVASGTSGVSEELTTCILSAFSNQEKLSFKELLTYVHKEHSSLIETHHLQDKDIKDELLKYADYISKGLYKHYYELKADYRDHTGAALVKEG